MVRIEEGFELIGKSLGNIQVGQPASVAVRPWKIVLLDQPTSKYPNYYPAEILAAVFLGSFTRYQVSFKETGSCIVQKQNIRDAHAFERGDHVYIAWTAEDNFIIPERKYEVSREQWTWAARATTSFLIG